jgi:tetratricopeptide (TPR) repeat protein
MFRFKRKVERHENLPRQVQDDLADTELATAEDAEPVWRRVARKYPDYVPGRLNFAATLLQLGRIVEAEEEYRRAAADHPQEVGARAGLATVLAAKGEFDEAERLAAQALAEGYDWAPCQEVIAQARLARGDQDGAAEAYLTAYEMSPHGWDSLQRYCELKGRSFTAPTASPPVEPCITSAQLIDLMNFIESAASSPDEHGGRPGCDHTLRFSKLWAQRNGVDFVDLYQYLNAHGGFCDCEVCLNVSNVLDEE